MTVLGVVILLGGALSLIAGVADVRRHKQVRAGGQSAWALIVAAPMHPEYEPSGYRPLLRFETEAGQSVEVFSPLAPTKRVPLIEGRKVLVHYDPADPAQVVVHGSRARSDLVFIVLGVAAIAGAMTAMALV